MEYIDNVQCNSRLKVGWVRIWDWEKLYGCEILIEGICFDFDFQEENVSIWFVQGLEDLIYYGGLYLLLVVV